MQGVHMFTNMSFPTQCLDNRDSYWKYCRKYESIGGSLKALFNLRSAPTSISINRRTKACYSDYIINSKDKNKSEYPQVKLVSECFIKTKYEVQDSTKPYHLGPMDLAMLFGHHLQFGFLYKKPSKMDFSTHKFLTSLKESLSHTLVHFYPLAGRFVIEDDKHKHETRVYVDCNKGPGARFIHAILDMSISNLLSQNEHTSLVVGSFFDLNEEVVNYNDYKKPLLCVQVTELIDGFFIACSVNHCMVDGASYWHFWSIWSEIHRQNNGTTICDSRLPVYNHWLLNRPDSPIPLPFIDQNELVRKWEHPQLKERIFQFSAGSIAMLKAKAIEEGNVNNISSFQALCALVWRSMIQANNLPNDHVIYIHLAANIRDRFNPPLPKYSFGNFMLPCTTITTAGELLENNLGWAASLLHQSVANLNDSSVRETLQKLEKSPFFYNLEDFLPCDCILIANSPRFDMYGHEFGLGKAITCHSGYGNKAPGFVLACPGTNGGGSVDLVIQLPICSMNALESNEEFTSFASLPQ